ncbi:S-layer homology domain-containing protein [Roseivirga sp. BDSF3-8]|uniref:S-layer homology domain-containing protein n=1 Tax=Roseivirga sp. BDSF3-8 TaxID=3241598 RepID=UPI0035325879
MKKVYQFTGIILLILVSVLGWYSISTQNTPSANEKMPDADQRLTDKAGTASQERLGQLKTTGAVEAAHLEYLKTMDPTTGQVPVLRGLEAFRAARRQAANLRAIPGVVWDARGPSDVAGRVRSLMFDPNDPNSTKVWAASETGGLWYNNDITNPSSSWYNVDDFWTNLNISSLAYDPTNPTHYYAATGVQYDGRTRPGAGIWKSTDQGQTWTQMASTTGTNFRLISAIAFTPSGTLLATTNDGIYRSADQGLNWTKVQGGDFLSDLEVDPNGIIYAGVQQNNNAGIYKSTDDGLSFTQLSLPASATGGQRVEIAVADSNPSVVYAVAGYTNVSYFIKSTDGGQTWASLSIPNLFTCNGEDTSADFTRGQAIHDLVLEINPTDQFTVYLGGINLLRSVNGGASFAQVSNWYGSCTSVVHADQLTMAFRPGNTNEAVFGNDGGVYYSPVAGDRTLGNHQMYFNPHNKNLNITQFYSVDQRNTAGDDYMLAGTQDNGTQKFTLPGYANTTMPTGGDGGFAHIDQDNPDLQVTAYVYNYYWLSQDGGNTFKVFSDDVETGSFINPTDYDDDANVLYTVTDGSANYMYSTPLDNPTFSNITLIPGSTAVPGSITAIKVSPYTPNRIFIAVQGFLSPPFIYMVDNANTQSPTVTNLSPNGGGMDIGSYCSSLDVGASDNQILATFSNYGINTSVVETRDGGATWLNRQGNLPDMPIRWGLYHPKNTSEVMLATEVGVWSTDNITVSSPDWGVTNANLANVRCDMLKYRKSDGYVAVATYGRGVYTTNIWSYIDIKNHWAETEIRYMLENDLLAGYSDGTFRPDNELTRAEFATMIANIIDPPLSSDPAVASRSFTDISGHWAEANILQAARAGYLAGYGDGTFRPNEKITKLQITVSIANGLPVSGGTISQLDMFFDRTSIPTWAEQPIANALQNRLIANYPNKNYFTPNTNATRGLAVVTLYQALANLGRAPFSTNFYVVSPSGSRLAKNITGDAEDLALYPNPADNFLRLDIPDAGNSPVPYALYNLQGGLIANGEYTKGATLDVSYLSPGQYIVRVSVGDRLFSKKFVKK